MPQLVAHYDESPTELKGRVELKQYPLSAADHVRCTDGPVQTNIVYVVVQTPAAPHLLVPFGSYDEWSLRDRYNEAIRIMNTLGASTIACESYRRVTKKSWLKGRIAAVGPEVKLRRVHDNSLDFLHEGTGSAPRNPEPLRWPHEPGFSAAITSVLSNGATEVSLTITSGNTFGLKSGLALQLKALGFELGGGHDQITATSLRISAGFPPQPKKGWRL